ncbi:hypothetical protein [Corynebacterium flavescens]|uniref:hypothetical protein n=1 Tax=Corynebacterium flavescens TaxID=28028 RepID=UPI003FD1F5DE
MSINLFDAALGIEGSEPVEINVGEDFTLSLRTAHTGQQVVAFSAIEEKRTLDSLSVYNNKKLSESARETALAEINAAYAKALLQSLCTEDSKAEDIEGAAKLISDLAPNPRLRVYRQIGILSGVVDENGSPFPSTKSSKTKKSTNG